MEKITFYIAVLLYIAIFTVIVYLYSINKIPQNAFIFGIIGSSFIFIFTITGKWDFN